MKKRHFPPHFVHIRPMSGVRRHAVHVDAKGTNKIALMNGDDKNATLENSEIKINGNIFHGPNSLSA